MISISDSGFAAGTIVVAAATTPRYYEFQRSLAQVGAPVGSKELIVRSCDITQNFNDGIKMMVGEWVWFLGDDHSFDKNTLFKLLKHNVDVVVPITPCKGVPFMPCVIHGPTNGEVWHEDLPLYHWDELSGNGLFTLPKGDFIGQAGMLVRKHVLDKIGYPWFKCGQIDPGRLQEDMSFCHELQERGYTVYIDQEIVLDHYVITGVTARKHQGTWNPALKFNDDVMVIPDAKPKALDVPKQVGKSQVKWAPLPSEPVAV